MFILHPIYTVRVLLISVNRHTNIIHLLLSSLYKQTKNIIVQIKRLCKKKTRRRNVWRLKIISLGRMKIVFLCVLVWMVDVPIGELTLKYKMRKIYKKLYLLCVCVRNYLSIDLLLHFHNFIVVVCQPCHIEQRKFTYTRFLYFTPFHIPFPRLSHPILFIVVINYSAHHTCV